MQAVMQSYFGEGSQNQYCTGGGSVYQESLSCQNTTWGGSSCLVDKTFMVNNEAKEPTMIFIALAGCGLQGTVLWNVSVGAERVFGETKDLADARSGVCGAKGTETWMRCFSEQGGTCTLQNPTKFSNTFVATKSVGVSPSTPLTCA